MSTRKSPIRNNQEPERPPRLTVSREEARRRISERIELGTDMREKLRAPTSQTRQAADNAWDQMWTWSDYNATLLERLFDTPAIKDEYSREWVQSILMRELSIGELLERVDKHLAIYLARLQSIHGRVELYDEPPADGASRTRSARNLPASRADASGRTDWRDASEHQSSRRQSVPVRA